MYFFTQNVFIHFRTAMYVLYYNAQHLKTCITPENPNRWECSVDSKLGGGGPQNAYQLDKVEKKISNSTYCTIKIEHENLNYYQITFLKCNLKTITNLKRSFSNAPSSFQYVTAENAKHCKERTNLHCLKTDGLRNCVRYN